MNSVKTLKIAALFGFLSVLIGAFGAHGLEDVLIENQRLETYKTAVNYQFYHTLALLLVGVLMMSNPSKYLIRSAKMFVYGILFFSGSLYLLSLTNYTFIGVVTPIGGLFFIFGWLALYKSFSNIG
ncbi:MAG: hypothetical protein CMC94_04895 [Flavobacteriales bacterium]|nr:hypothetical protein [Flavobacteriales bacterium]|tara:strand:- start:302 stop:679 length:378 start_codon:yes stop_codon:yes gene_type:complete